MRGKACQDVGIAAEIALKLSQSSIHCVEDLWSSEGIHLDIRPDLWNINPLLLEEIIIQSFTEFLNRPGHVRLPFGMVIRTDDCDKEQNNSLWRVRKLWEYWHGSPTLDSKKTRTVSVVLNC